jgi:invasion protein IalB
LPAELIVIKKASVCWGLLAFLFANAALAQQSTSSTSVFDSWVLRCRTSSEQRPASKLCEVNTTLTAKTTDGRQAVVMIVGYGKPAVDKPNQLVVNAPLSAWLPAGIKMQDKAGKLLLDLPFTSCKPNMCAAVAAVSDAQWSVLMAAGEEILALYRSQAGQDFKIQVPLKGLTAAYKAMLKETAVK